MTKIYCDKQNLDRTVHQYLDDALVNIKNAIRKFDSMGIPSDFKYKTYLRQTYVSISSYRDEINNLNQKMRSSYNSFANINDSAMKQVRAIDNYKIPPRQTAIR